MDQVRKNVEVRVHKVRSGKVQVGRLMGRVLCSVATVTGHRRRRDK